MVAGTLTLQPMHPARSPLMKEFSVLSQRCSLLSEHATAALLLVQAPLLTPDARGELDLLGSCQLLTQPLLPRRLLVCLCTVGYHNAVSKRRSQVA